MNTRETLSRPRLLRMLMQANGYKADDRGVCSGISVKAVEAFLCGELPQFDDRIEWIYAWYLENENVNEPVEKIIKVLADKIKAVKDKHAILSEAAHKINQKIIPSTNDAKIFEMLALFEDIEICHNPDFYPGWLPPRTNQSDIESISAVTAPAKLQAIGKVVKVNAWPGIYTYQDNNPACDLIKYCRALVNTAKTQNHDVAFILQSRTHRISVFYDAEKKIWKVTSSLPTITIKDNFVEELASAIYSAFVDEGPVAFETIVCTTENKKPAVANFVSALQKSPDFLAAQGIDPETKKIATAKTKYCTFKDNTTLLSMAVEGGYADIVFQLLADSKKTIKADLLRLSTAKAGDVNMIIAFAKLSKMLDPEAAKYLATLAAQFGQTEVLKELAASGKVDLNEMSKSLLHIAYSSGQLDVINLLNKFVDVHDKNDQGLTPAVQAAMNGHANVLEFLLKQDNFLDDPKQFEQVVRFAAKNGHVSVFDFLIKHQVHNNPDRNGLTPLFHAIKSRQENLVRYLARQGKVNLDKANLSGQTPALYAAERGQIAMLQTLANEGADLALRAPCGKTPLEIATETKEMMMKENNNSSFVESEWNKVIAFLESNTLPKQKTESNQKEHQPKEENLPIKSEKKASSLIDSLWKKIGITAPLLEKRTLGNLKEENKQTTNKSTGKK